VLTPGCWRSPSLTKETQQFPSRLPRAALAVRGGKAAVDATEPLQRPGSLPGIRSIAIKDDLPTGSEAALTGCRL